MPIAGAAILIGDPPPSPTGEPPDMLLLSVRLPPKLDRLTPVIIRYFERDTVGAGRK
jgi:hypothetical protein